MQLLLLYSTCSSSEFNLCNKYEPSLRHKLLSVIVYIPLVPFHAVPGYFNLYSMYSYKKNNVCGIHNYALRLMLYSIS